MWARSSLYAISLCCPGGKDEPGFPYEGGWKGNYTGANDNGTISANISSTGQITGTAYSNPHDQTFSIIGTVSSDGILGRQLGRLHPTLPLPAPFPVTPVRGPGITKVPDSPAQGP